MREDDVSEAIRDFAIKPRGEFESAFPDLGSVLALVNSKAFKRRMDEERAQRRAEMEALERDRREHPEKYISFEKIMSDFKESRGREKQN